MTRNAAEPPLAPRRAGRLRRWRRGHPPGPRRGKNATPVVPASVAGAFHAGLGDTIDIVVAVVLGKAEGDSSIDPVTKC